MNKLLFLFFLVLSVFKINTMLQKPDTKEQGYETDDEKEKKKNRKIRLLPPQLRKQLFAIQEQKEDNSRPTSPVEENQFEPYSSVTKIDISELERLLQELSTPSTPNETTIEENTEKSPRYKRKRKDLLKYNKRFRLKQDDKKFDCEEK